MRITLYRGPDAQRMALDAVGSRPFPMRAPHSTSSYRSILGSLRDDGDKGLDYTPGELGLATGGVLLLTDLPEFRRDVIELIGGAMRAEQVILRTRNHWLRVPVRFSVIATATDCPCGRKPCAGCSREVVGRFERRIQWAMDAFRGPDLRRVPV